MSGLLQMIRAWAAACLPRLFGGAAIVIIGFWSARKAAKLLRLGLERTKLDKTIHGFISIAVKTAIQALILVSAAGAVGIQTNGFVAVLGGTAVAVSLALQGSLSNVASGLLLLFNRPFGVGDFVEVDGNTGEVRNISLMFTELSSPDGKRIIVPNATLTGRTLINYSAERFRRVDISFSVAVNSDLTLARQVLYDLVDSYPLCRTEPKPRIAVSSFGPDGVVIAAWIWCERKDYLDLLYGFPEHVRNAFVEKEIEVPYANIVLRL
jgi:small conductance mechanosensitive channel